MLKKEYLILRCDASSIIGYGHLMRSIAIAQGAICENIIPVFLISEYSEKATNLLNLYELEFYIINQFEHNDDLDSTLFICEKFKNYYSDN